jgi:hypothetical protein
VVYVGTVVKLGSALETLRDWVFRAIFMYLVLGLGISAGSVIATVTLWSSGFCE